MFKAYPLSSRFIVFVLVPLLLAGVAGMAYFHRSLPPTRGSLGVKGLEARLTLQRDAQGVVYLRGGSAHDVYFGMGVAQAQDRLWQLELLRRVVQGRLSEVFGRRTLDQDAWFRTLGLYQAAAAAEAALTPAARASLQAYADGINAWLATRPTLPPEFALLGVRPQPWRPVDSLAIVKLFALDLAGNLPREIERMQAASLLDTAQLRSLDPDYPSDAPVTVQAPSSRTATQLAALLPLMKGLETQLGIGGRYVGSNAWVVAGRFVAGGRPLLANDPHLALGMPSMWYAVSQSGGPLQASGMSLVGLPVVVFGRNEHIAWGGTNMMADVQDLYMEHVDAQHPGQYRTAAGQWQAFRTREETIEVKADFPAALRAAPKPVAVHVRETAHGPVVSDVIAALEQPVALRWTALDTDDTTYEAFFRASYAQDWSQFRDAFSRLVAPALNLLYADQAGHIGYLGAGRVPLRRTGDGELPVPGDNERYAWDGFIPAAQMPQSFDPPQGFLVSANQRVAGNDYPYFISRDWAPPARAERITQLLQQQIAAGRKLDAAGAGAMQSDVMDLDALRMRPRLTAIAPADEAQRQALHLLATWDGRMSRDSAAATIYVSWMDHLRTRLFDADAAQSWRRGRVDDPMRVLAANASVDAVLDALRGEGGWCDAAGGPRGCDTALREALSASLDELRKLAGSDMASWRWGQLHTLRLAHQPFSEVSPLDRVFARQLPGGGSPSTINAANARWTVGEGYVQDFGPSFRQVISLDGRQHLFILPSGQSGHPLSAHYDDMGAAYAAGRFDDMAARAPRNADTLVLEPR